MKPKNPYQENKDYLRDPCEFLSQVTQEEFEAFPSDIQLIFCKAQSIDEMIAGDFNQEVLEDLITQCRSNAFQWIITGIYAWKVKVNRLYKNTHQTFEDFCNKALGLSHWMINGYIRAAQVWGKLVTAGFSVLPKNESQCRPLLKLSETELIETWSEITRGNAEHKISRSIIETSLGIVEESVTIKLSPKAKAALKAKADKEGLTLTQYLERLAGIEEKIIEVKEPETKKEETKKVKNSDNCHTSNFRPEEKNVIKNSPSKNERQYYAEVSHPIQLIKKDFARTKPQP